MRLRDAAVQVLLCFGVLTVALTEILSVFGMLRPVSLLGGWLAAGAAALLFRRRLKVEKPGAFEIAAIGAICLELAIIATTAALSPPNSTDAMGYHMPRVLYWAQEGSVVFFPTHYYPQITLQPFAEYVALHTYVLSGGDRFINLVQLAAFAGAIVVVTLIAGELGAGRRGQSLAAVLCATLPNAILQASGAKNDSVLALWLAMAALFGLRFVRERSWRSLVCLSAAAGLALLTKGTAYVMLPGILMGVFLPAARSMRWWLPRVASVMIPVVLLINGPFYWRNYRLSGWALGYRTAHGNDGHAQWRWTNTPIGIKQTVSNAARTLAEQIPARSPAWNQAVYDATIKLHEMIGLDPNDPGNTWRYAQFEPPRNSNHEANAANRWHLMLFVIAAPFAVRCRQWIGYYGGIVIAFVLFCAILRWQPFAVRMLLGLYVLACPVIAAVLEALAPLWLQLGLAILLMNGARPFLLENWVRPLKGPSSLFITSREDNYFSDMKEYGKRAEYKEAARMTLVSGCKAVGIDNSILQLEYPYEALVLAENPNVRFQHVGVANDSGRDRSREFRPCAVFCLDCSGVDEKVNALRVYGTPHAIGRSVLFVSAK